MLCAHMALVIRMQYPIMVSTYILSTRDRSCIQHCTDRKTVQVLPKNTSGKWARFVSVRWPLDLQFEDF